MTSLSPIQPNTNLSDLQLNSYNEITVGKQRVFQCSIPLCEKTFKYKSEIHRHLGIHSNFRPFHCLFPGCGKTFKRQDAFDNHSRIHVNLTPYSCPLENCRCKFVSKPALNYHLLKHSDRRIFQCDQPGCDKAFTTLGQLKQHLKSSPYHRKPKDISQKGEDTTVSYDSSENESFQSFQATESSAVIPMIPDYLFEDLSEPIKKIKESHSDSNIPENILIEQINNLNEVENTLGESIEGGEFNNYINEGFLNQFLGLDRQENDIITDAYLQCYDFLKLLIEEDERKKNEFLLGSSLFDPFQSILSGANTLDSSFL